MGNQIGISEATGDVWKSIKKSTSGPFSIIRLKKSMQLYNDCNKHMLEYIDRQIDAGNTIIDSSSVLPNISMDVLASVGLGVNINTFTEPNDEFKTKTDNIFVTKRWELVQLLPNIASLLRIKVFNPDSVKYIMTIIKRTMEQRKNGGTLGKDILGAIIKHKEDNPQDENFDVILKTYVQFVGDANFTLPGMLGATLYYIISHPEVYSTLIEEQERVFDENGGRCGNLTEEEVNQLTYLDMVILETTRLVCFPKMSRLCTKAWKIPDSNVVIPSGTEIVVPVSAIHKDSEYWESPEEFIPERFSTKNKGKIQSGTYFPFGTGPRQCLGEAYVKLHIKITVTHLLRNYTLHNFENLPRVMKRPHVFAFLPKEGLKLKLTRRKI
jgi:cytochrome P450 family 6